MIVNRQHVTKETSHPPRPPTPLLPLALGLAIGIIIDNSVALPTWAAVGVLSIGMGIGLIGRRRLSAMYAAVLITAVGLGILRHAVADRWLPDNHIVAFTKREPILATLTGRVATEPSIAEPDPAVPRAFSIGPKTRFLLQATSIAGRDGPLNTVGRITVSIKEPLLGVHLGDQVRMTGWLYRPSGPQNPGDYDWARHLRRQGIYAGLSCDHAAAVIALKKSTSVGWAGWLDGLRNHFRGYLTDQAFRSDDPAAGVVAAMVLGQRNKVSQSMNETFLKTGNVHFLAASGMHVAWLALLGWGVCRVIGLGYRTSALIVAGLIVSYVLLAEPRPSILRAGIIGVLACSSAFFRGRFNAVNSLACAAVIILMIRPSDLFTPAFQFSFLATLGLLHFCPKVSQTIFLGLLQLKLIRVARLFIVRSESLMATQYEQLDNRRDADASLVLGSTHSTDVFPVSLLGDYEHESSLLSSMARKLAVLVAQLFALALSEWIITTPLACYLFDRFIPFGWLGTFILAPFAMLTTSAGFLTILLGLVFPSSGLVLGPLLGGATRLMLGCVEMLTHLPGTTLDGRSPTLAWLLTVYAVIWLWSYRRNWIAWRLGFWASVAMLILWWLVAPYRPSHNDGTLNVWMLAVGDGTGTVIELPDGRVMVYDFGTRSPFDAGQLGLNFMRHRGIRHIDTVFVSHPDFDHYGGIETIAEHLSIGRVMINDQFQAFVEEKSAASRFLESVRSRGIPIEVVSGPHLFDSGNGVIVESLWPPPADNRFAPDDNDSSTVLRITFQDRTILLTGDISEWGIGGLLARGDLHADALALPHHGSVVGNTAAFIEAVSPQIAVRSSGQHRRLTTNHIESLVGDRQYFNTADRGCVVVRIENGKITAKATLPHD